MKKSFIIYAICWFIFVALFNIIIFFARPIIPNYVIEYDARFWVSWAVILVAFIGNLVCAWYAFSQNSLKKLFYNIPLISVSYTGAILMLIVGLVCMLVPDFPAWLTVIICAIILVFNLVSVLKATFAAKTVATVDDKVEKQTQFIKLATINAENIMNRAKNDSVKVECRKVYEALRYSDPMSSDALSVEEAKITVKLDELANAVDSESDNISDIVDELVLLVKDRNNKCKARK